MTSGVSWNELGANPEAQRGAGDAARRAGLSSGRERSGSGSISARLEELSHRIGGLGGDTGAAAPIASSVRGARLSETVAKLNARLAQMTSGADLPGDVVELLFQAGKIGRRGFRVARLCGGHMRRRFIEHALACDDFGDDLVDPRF